MNILSSCLLALQYEIPGFFSILFRIFGLGVKNKKRMTLGLLFYVVVSFVLPVALIMQIGYQNYKQLVPAVMMGANFSVFIMSSDNFQKTSFLHLSQANAVYWISTVVGSLRRVWGFSYVISDVIRFILSFAAFYFGLRYFAKPMRFMADTIRNNWMAMLTIPAGILLVGCAIAVQLNTVQPYPALFLVAMISLMELSFFLYMRVLYRSLQDSVQLSKEQNRQAVLQAELLAYDDAVTSAKCCRHDIRHHNAVMLEYIQAGDLAGAEAYLQSTDNQLAFPALRQFCENHVANAFFRIYDRACRQADVTLNIKGNIPEKVPLTASEMGALIGNLLENALNACKKVELSPYISVEFHVEGDTLCGSIENSVLGTVSFSGGFPQSQRSDGIGTRSIAAILRKYDGAVRWWQEYAVFYTQIILPL